MTRKRKKLLHQVGVTPEGRQVMGGVYAFYETHGLPLDDILAGLWDRGAVPDWLALVRDMVDAGRPLDRAFEAVRTAANDACYPPEAREAIQAGLARLQLAMGEVKTSPDE